MLRQRLTLFLAITSGCLTIIIGLLENVRGMTILYRAAISIIIFAFLGYLCGYLAELFLQKLYDQLKPKGQKLDVVSAGDNGIESLPVHDGDTEHDFTPFTPDSFDHVEEINNNP